MRKQLLALTMGAAALFTGCQESTLSSAVAEGATTFNVSVEGELTRASSDATRFLMEIYDSSDAIVAEGTSSTGQFSAILLDDQEYTAVFWADVNGDEVYNTESLKAVSLEADLAAEAWAGSVSFTTDGTTSTSVTLKRAVAKLTLKETAAIPADNSLKVSFNQYTVFNASTMAVESTVSQYENTFAITSAVEGTEESPVVIATDIYVLASAEGSLLQIVDFSMYNEDEADSYSNISITSVPVKANSNTNVIGHYITDSNYDLSVDLDDTWDGDEDVNMGEEGEGDDEGTDEPQTTAPVISAIEDVAFAVAGETKTVDVVVSDQGELEVKAVSSDPTQFAVSVSENTITIVAAENTDTENGTTATITVSVEGATDVTFGVSQDAAEVPAATTITTTITASDLGSSYPLLEERTIDGITFVMNNVYSYSSNIGTRNDGSSYLYNCNALEGLSKVVIPVNTLTVYEGSSMNPQTTEVTAVEEDGNYVYTITAGSFVRIENASSSYVNPASIAFTYEAVGALSSAILSVSPESLTFAATEVTGQDAVISGIALDGATIDVAVTEGSEYFSASVSGTTLTVTPVGENSTDASYTGTVEVSINGTSASIEVSQTGAEEAASEYTVITATDLETTTATTLTTYTIGDYTLTFALVSGSNPPKYYSSDLFTSPSTTVVDTWQSG